MNVPVSLAKLAMIAIAVYLIFFIFIRINKYIKNKKMAILLKIITIPFIVQVWFMSDIAFNNLFIPPPDYVTDRQEVIEKAMKRKKMIRPSKRPQTTREQFDIAYTKAKNAPYRTGDNFYYYNAVLAVRTLELYKLIRINLGYRFPHSSEYKVAWQENRLEWDMSYHLNKFIGHSYIIESLRNDVWKLWYGLFIENKNKIYKGYYEYPETAIADLVSLDRESLVYEDILYNSFIDEARELFKCGMKDKKRLIHWMNNAEQYDRGFPYAAFGNCMKNLQMPIY